MPSFLHPRRPVFLAHKGRAAGRWGLPGLCVVLLALAACGGDPDPYQAYREARYDAARAGFERLASQGDLQAVNALGVMHLLGLAGTRDPIQARDLFLRAAQGGHADAQRNLGMLHERGLAVPKSRVLAYGWYDLAARGGHAPARAQAEALGAQLSANMARQGREQVKQLLREGAHLCAGPPQGQPAAGGCPPDEVPEPRDPPPQAQHPASGPSADGSRASEPTTPTAASPSGPREDGSRGSEPTTPTAASPSGPRADGSRGD